MKLFLIFLLLTTLIIPVSAIAYLPSHHHIDYERGYYSGDQNQGSSMPKAMADNIIPFFYVNFIGIPLLVVFAVILCRHPIGIIIILILVIGLIGWDYTTFQTITYNNNMTAFMEASHPWIIPCME